MRVVSHLSLWFLLLGGIFASTAFGDDLERGELIGHVIDEETAEVLPGASVYIRELDRGRATDVNGRFRFQELRPRAYTVTASFVGFASSTQTVEIGEGETVEIVFELGPSSLALPDVVVTGTARARGISEVYRPTSVLGGGELERNMGSSVPETLNRVPGFSMQYNGPGAASPTIRGLSGDRILMLEDGHRTGDLYQTAADHGVMVEPLTAERMEVVRGPAGLLYGSNALGGVVNVIRNDIPRSRPSQITGTVSSQVQSVNAGFAAGGRIAAPLGPLAVTGEMSLRRAGDTRTPEGVLPTTQMGVHNASAGASWTPDWGLIGASYRFYDNTYGVPGEFNGELIPGAHPGGVEIEAQRHILRLRSAYTEELLGFFDGLELDGGITRYRHDEIEQRLETGADYLGACFDQWTSEANLTARHQHRGDDIRAEGAAGLSLHGRNLTTGCGSPGSRSADSWTLSGFTFEEFGRAPFRLQLGLRYDYNTVAPRDQSDIQVRTREERIIKPVESRQFGAFSGSIATLYDLSADWTVGASVARSFRNPVIEELYSDGPHLADFSFDIGSPDLEPEIGYGFDLFIRSPRPDFDLELAVYYNRIDNFIYYRPTGQTVTVIREGARPRATPVFEARGDHADFLGGEGRIQFEPMAGLALDATGSYTRGTRRVEGDPLPAIPPFSGHLEARYTYNDLFASVGIDAAAPQNRVPAPIDRGGDLELPERPTDGHTILSVGLGWRFAGDVMFHSINLQANNLTNRVWRDHLSRIKDVAPQPGRNLRLTYRVEF